MASDEFAVVVVRVEKKNGNRVAVCYPDGVNLYQDGPRKIRWVFQEIPAEISSVAINFFAEMPKKYGDKPIIPISPGNFGGPQNQAVSSSGARLKDVVVALPQRHEGKYFFYEVRLRGTGSDIVCDPGGVDQPTEQPLPFPP